MSELSLPPEYPTVPPGVYDDMKLVKLAREIAMGIKEIPDILADHGLTYGDFENLQSNARFNRMLASELADWATADNTPERIKLKSGAMLEEYLPELYARLNDPSEPLMAKIKAVEVVARLAGFGEKDITPSGTPGDRVQVIINLGADTKLEYRKQLPTQVTDQVIDASPNPV